MRVMNFGCCKSRGATRHKQEEEKRRIWAVGRFWIFHLCAPPETNRLISGYALPETLRKNRG